MKKIDELTLENFKFFRGLETLKFNSKNILVYGENGSGKSSLYWALYTFMQSSLKEDNEIKKYFNNQHPERLINIFKEDDDKSSIKLTLKNKLNIKSTYEISFDNINTNKGDKEILKANLASDFINYRLLSKLYNFKNSQNIEIFDMFEDEIFQYITIDGENFNNLWQRLKKGISPRPKMSDQKYKDFQKDIKDFNEKFKNYLQTLIRKTNEILKDLRFILDGYPDGKRITGETRDKVLDRLKKETGFVDFITISSSLCFSMNYGTSLEHFEKDSLYNNVRQSNYRCDGYLDGVNRVKKDYRDLFAKYRNYDNVVFLVDPPYLSTDTTTYNRTDYWKLTDYLNVLKVIEDTSYFYFTSNKSQIIELCDWMENNGYCNNPFYDSTTVTVGAQLTHNARYNDIMIYRNNE